MNMYVALVTCSGQKLLDALQGLHGCALFVLFIEDAIDEAIAIEAEVLSTLC